MWFRKKIGTRRYKVGHFQNLKKTILDIFNWHLGDVALDDFIREYGGQNMEKVLTFADSDEFYGSLLEMESRKEEYFIDTGIIESKDLPLRLLHHIGVTKDDVAHLQHKVVEEPAWMHEFIEPLIVKFNEWRGKYQPARGYEFRVETEDYDSIKIHGRPKAAA
ncbi:MAG: hypothetical protein IPL01_12430 [Acidobacteria bacterium]|nr:hypothetical protein [Acidobacteriota bacterium]